MEFFEAVESRRSIRRFLPDPIPDDVVRKALEAAILAPNSSNVQAWHFHWVKTEDSRRKIIEYCLSQSAARTAQTLIVITADPGLWRRSQKALVKWVEDVRAPKPVVDYYRRVVPLVYRWGLLNVFAPIKWLIANGVGLFRPMLRGPYTRRDLQEVTIKSAALAAENFVLAMSAQGYATCMMEGFDERRVKRLLSLPLSARVVMVIGAGRAAERGTWGPRFRLDLEQVVTEV